LEQPILAEISQLRADAWLSPAGAFEFEEPKDESFAF
jgi:hypothetical protein